MDRTKLFGRLDDFTNTMENQKLLVNPECKRNRPCGLCVSEVITILVLFHFSHFRTFKHFYQFCLRYYRADFPGLPSYQRFVERIGSALTALCAFLLSHTGEPTGVAFIDSTSLEVCDPHRIHSHRVFRDVAQRGKTSTGWFFGFKLHLIVNDRGELLAGKMFGDKGYISQPLFNHLWRQGLQLITRIKKNMKNKLTPLWDKILLRKRAIIESVHNILKNQCGIEHSRHRSRVNFMAHLIAGLVAYVLLPKHPSLNLGRQAAE
ncbi:MAG TPA: transposase [Burkholderiales bacterium]|nr:transposase [Burkholderiales bacterium]